MTKRFIGGPLDGQVADTRMSAYRDADGARLHVRIGDAIQQRRGPQRLRYIGIYIQCHQGYRWREPDIS